MGIRVFMMPCVEMKTDRVDKFRSSLSYVFHITTSVAVIMRRLEFSMSLQQLSLRDYLTRGVDCILESKQDPWQQAFWTTEKCMHQQVSIASAKLTPCKSSPSLSRQKPARPSRHVHNSDCLVLHLVLLFETFGPAIRNTSSWHYQHSSPSKEAGLFERTCCHRWPLGSGI